MTAGPRLSVDTFDSRHLFSRMLPRREEDRVGGPYVLEDMISDLQARGHDDAFGRDADASADPLELLKQREKDLVLAAELGKALLERNQELMRKSDAVAEEYGTKLEVRVFPEFTFPCLFSSRPCPVLFVYGVKIGIGWKVSYRYSGECGSTFLEGNNLLLDVMYLFNFISGNFFTWKAYMYFQSTNLNSGKYRNSTKIQKGTSIPGYFGIFY